MARAGWESRAICQLRSRSEPSWGKRHHTPYRCLKRCRRAQGILSVPAGWCLAEEGTFAAHGRLGFGTCLHHEFVCSLLGSRPTSHGGSINSFGVSSLSPLFSRAGQYLLEAQLWTSVFTWRIIFKNVECHAARRPQRSCVQGCGLPAALQVLSLFQQKPKGLGIEEQIIMNKTSGGLFSSAKINELSNKCKISQVLKFTF